MEEVNSVCLPSPTPTPVMESVWGSTFPVRKVKSLTRLHLRLHHNYQLERAHLRRLRRELSRPIQNLSRPHLKERRTKMWACLLERKPLDIGQAGDHKEDMAWWPLCGNWTASFIFLLFSPYTASDSLNQLFTKVITLGYYTASEFSPRNVSWSGYPKKKLQKI